MGRKSGLRRQASVDARKQILKVRGDFLELSEDDDDDEEVVEVDEPTTKKYKVSARKSDGDLRLRLTVLNAEPTLDMEVWTDELSPAQLEHRRVSIAARDQVTHVIEDIVKVNDGRLLVDTPTLTAVELATLVNPEGKQSTPAPAHGAKAVRSVGRPRLHPAPPAKSGGYQLVLDSRTSAAIGTAISSLGANTPSRIAATAPTTAVPKKKYWKVNSTSTTPTTQTLVPIIRTELQPMVQTTPSFQSFVDLTADDGRRSTADTKEVSFNRLQGKTFPSLVVVARPTLRLPLSTTENRHNLDRKVKKILMNTPAQFAEYLIQQGLVKSEHFCQTHPGNKLKLGMYSEASRFPHSGGYIWISDCCPPKFVSVFHESLFEGTHPPSTNFKLIYHWACQTNVQNVLQWVKIENIYLKGLYTWMRGICTVALHTHMELLGGKGSAVEVGVISLGTTTQDGVNRQVKVEVLGVLETKTQRIMLRAVDPNDVELAGKTQKKRFTKILEPLKDWVHPESTIVIDMTIEKTSLNAIGFPVVARNGSGNFTNQNIMDYLRRIVPRMFQNTLSLLSRQIIQQFLDELVWRELYGCTSHEAFHSILKHIAEQTSVDSGVSFYTRLNKVASNPFKNWSIASQLKKTTQEKRRKPYTSAASSLPATPASTAALTAASALVSVSGMRVAQVPKQMTALEPYYYGSIICNKELKEVELNIQCPICQKMHTSNIDLLLHLFRHVSNADYFCKYCLADCGSKHNLYTHLELKHATETKAGRFFNCLICHDKFNSIVVLGKHMAIEHSPAELPYHCDTCNFKSSSHKTIIDHFYKVHRNQGVLQCPFCLMSTDLHGGGESLSQNVNKFVSHLTAHCKKGKNPKGLVRKCARCDLQFLSKEEFDDHADRHISYRNEPNYKPYTEPKNCYMVPKSIRDDDIKDKLNCVLRFSMPEHYSCKECGKKIVGESHFKDIMYCNKGDCKYETLCRSAMINHKAVCSILRRKMQSEPLGCELYCICRFSSADGNEMARHLAVCDRKSAYPSSEAAAKATITPGMLDVLGLVRKLEDSSTKPEEVVKKAPSARATKRKWRMADVNPSDNEDDADDPDYNTSDEDFRPIRKRKPKPLHDDGDSQTSKEEDKVEKEAETAPVPVLDVVIDTDLDKEEESSTSGAPVEAVEESATKDVTEGEEVADVAPATEGEPEESAEINDNDEEMRMETTTTTETETAEVAKAEGTAESTEIPVEGEGEVEGEVMDL